MRSFHLRAARSSLVLSLLAAAALASTGCVEEPSAVTDGAAINDDSDDEGAVGEARSDLFVLSTAVWGTTSIPVCWETSGNDAQKAWVRQAVKATWETETGLVFEGWGTCNASTSKGIRIRTADEWPHTVALGNELNNVQNGMVLNFWYNFWGQDSNGNWYQPFGACIGASAEQCTRNIAVHEFGHALGFAHEQNRGDTPSTCTQAPQGESGDTNVGGWDATSIMNYCNPTWNNGGKLSAGDVAGARRFYGYNPGLDMQIVAADMNGDKRADMLQLYRGFGSIPVCASTSGGNYSCTNQGATIYDWGSPAQQYLTGDFNGDGLADAVQAYRKWGSFPTCYSNGAGGWNCANAAATLYDSADDTAEQRFLVGRFKYNASCSGGFYLHSDKDDDIIQVYRKWSTIPLCASNNGAWQCSNPSAAIYDSGSREQQFLTGDFNGDGLTDVFQTYRGWGSMPVCTSDGCGHWNCSNPAASIYDSGSAEQRFMTGDFNGDGKTDIIQAYRGWGAVPVCLSTGSGWNCGVWYGSFYDSGSTDQQFLTGDFNGDGKTDLAQVHRGWSNALSMCLSTGSGWNCSVWGGSFADSGSNEQRFVAADVNGDGKTDIVQTYRGWSNYPVCLSTGSGLSCSVQPATIYNPNY